MYQLRMSSLSGRSQLRIIPGYYGYEEGYVFLPSIFVTCSDWGFSILIFFLKLQFGVFFFSNWGFSIWGFTIWVSSQIWDFRFGVFLKLGFLNLGFFLNWGLSIWAFFSNWGFSQTLGCTLNAQNSVLELQYVDYASLHVGVLCTQLIFNSEVIMFY